jgi:hypothetical protein
MSNNNIIQTIQDYLDQSNDNSVERLEKIEDLLHLLNYEKRITELTDEEADAMIAASAGSLSDKERELLAQLSPEKREVWISKYARQQLFIQYAWSNYINGITDYKPVDSKRKANYMWDLLKDQIGVENS